jgi:hypothetical protein
MSIPSTMGEPVKLADLEDLEDRFRVASEEVARNIRDLDTDATATRSIIIELVFKPGSQRTSADVIIKTKVKLAPMVEGIAGVNISHAGLTVTDQLDTNVFQLVPEEK